MGVKLQLQPRGRDHKTAFFPQQKNSEMSNVLVVESDNSAQMSEVQSRSQMDTITELQEEEED